MPQLLYLSTECTQDVFFCGRSRRSPSSLKGLCPGLRMTSMPASMEVNRSDCADLFRLRFDVGICSVQRVTQCICGIGKASQGSFLRCVCPRVDDRSRGFSLQNLDKYPDTTCSPSELVMFLIVAFVLYCCMFNMFNLFYMFIPFPFL